MGLPFFFKQLLEYYGENKLILMKLNCPADLLYIDANCLFHPQCFKILELCKDTTDIHKLENYMFQRIINYIEFLISYVKPNKEVYICVDGVAPVAKISQQRKRRFRSIDDIYVKDNIKDKFNVKHNDLWNNSSITPGTKFMEDLHQYLIKYIESKKNEKLKYFYSSYHTPGEGEHKILQIIKKKTTNDICVIYGLDADLIFLSLASQKNNIFLLRESSQLQGHSRETTIKTESKSPINDVNEELRFVSVDKIKECYYDQLRNIITQKLKVQKGFVNLPRIKNKKYDKMTDLINDFIFICFFLGNDFLPQLPSLDVRKYGLDIILDVYTNVLLELCENIIKINPLKINMNFLSIFLQKLGELEENYFTSIVPEYNRRQQSKKCTSTDPYTIELWNLENMKNIKIIDTVNLGSGTSSEWKFRYYEHYFGVSEHMSDHVSNMCMNYLEGIYWISNYYFIECPSQYWQYAFTHSPFISDISKFLKEHNSFDLNTVFFQKTEPLKPCEQLLAVLPPACYQLLPKSYQFLVKDSDSPIIHMFPSKIELDFINKDMYWQCIPMIPFLNIEELLNGIINLKLTDDEEKRNITVTTLNANRV